MVTPLPSTVAGTTVHETEVKRSRFVCRLAHVPDVVAADAVIAEVRKERWDARHHCVALVVGAGADQQRSSDDGEPSGTAGVPMLEVLRHRGLTDVVAVVSRYFGGVLLGAGGLVRAYTAAVVQTIDSAVVVRRELRDVVHITTSFAEAGRTENFVRSWSASHDGVLDQVSYGSTGAVLALLVRPDQTATLAADLAVMSGGTLHARVAEQRVVDLPATQRSG